MARQVFLLITILVCLIHFIHSEDVNGDVDGTEEVVEDTKVLEYSKGSLCGYCDYCKFCKLCDEDCPCETGPTKPNCHMCKYCKYCYLCSGLCDTICQPGGIIDKVSSTLVSALASEVDKDEVDKEIKNVQHWIDKKKDEL